MAGGGGGVVGDGGGKDGDVHAADVHGNGVMHFGGGFDRDEIDIIGHNQIGGAGDEEYRVALVGEGAARVVAHFAGGAVRQEAHRIDRFAGGAGGDKDFHDRSLTSEEGKREGEPTVSPTSAF